MIRVFQVIRAAVCRAKRAAAFLVYLSDHFRPFQYVTDLIFTNIIVASLIVQFVFIFFYFCINKPILDLKSL